MLNLLAKVTQSLFLIRQYAPAPSRVCRPLCVTADGLPVWTDNFFSCNLTAQLIPRAFKTHCTEMETLLPETSGEPSASHCSTLLSTYGCCRLTPPHISPCKTLQAQHREELFNTLNTALHLQWVTDLATVFPFLCQTMHSPDAPHGPTPPSQPSLAHPERTGMIPTALPTCPPLQDSSSLQETLLEKASIIPRVFALGSGNEECQQSCCDFSVGDTGANKDQPKVRVPRCQGNYSSSPSFSCLYIFFFQYYA